MVVLRSFLQPSEEPNQVIAPSKRRNMLDPELYTNPRRRNAPIVLPSQNKEQKKFAGVVTDDQAQRPNFADEPVTGNALQTLFESIKGREAPPLLEPGARVKNANMDLVNSNNFQSFRDRLDLIGSIGDVQVQAAQAAAAYKRQAALNAANNPASPSRTAGTTGGTGGIPPTGQMPAPGNVNQTQAIVRDIAARQFGWSGAEWDALYGLVQRESGWNPAAANPTSAARGLFQKMINMHGPIESTVEGQAAWGLNYIRQRYGSPSRALQHWLSRVPINGQDVGHWY